MRHLESFKILTCTQYLGWFKLISSTIALCKTNKTD